MNVHSSLGIGFMVQLERNPLSTAPLHFLLLFGLNPL